MPVFQRTAVDNAGNVMPLASVEVRDQVTSGLVQLYSNYALTSTIGNPMTADSEGFFRFYVATGRYRITASLGGQSRTWEDEVLGLDAELFDYRRSEAEISASVTPTLKYYKPGDIRRYGAVSGGSAATNSTAFQAAINVAQATTNPHDAVVYIPSSQAGYQISTGATASGSAPFVIRGDSAYYSYIYTSANICPLTISNMVQYQGVLIENLTILSTHSTPTLAGIHFKNSAYCRIVGCIIQGFFYNVRFEPTATAPQSCFSCSIEDSTIVGCLGTGSWNIRAEANTNHLNLRNVTFGGSALGGGLYCMDSGGLCIVGGDCESIGGPVAIDIDCTSDLRIGALITGVDFEGNANSLGQIRIGNTTIVRNVTLLANVFVNSNSSEWVVNPVRCDQLTLIGNAANTGTNSGFHINPSGTTQTNFFLANNTWQTNAVEVIKGTLGFADANVATAGWSGRHADKINAVTYSASITINASLGNFFNITIQDTAAFTINAPTNAVAGQEIEIWIVNGSGGAHGTITWNAIFHHTGALAAIANGSNKHIGFRFNGTNWYETYRTVADVAN